MGNGKKGTSLAASTRFNAHSLGGSPYPFISACGTSLCLLKAQQSQESASLPLQSASSAW